MSAQGKAIESLRGDVTRLTTRVDDVRGEVSDLRNDMNRGFEQVDQRLEQINRRFDAIDRRFDEMNSGLRALIEDVRSEVRLILELLAPTVTQVSDHERRLQVLEDKRGKPS